MALGTIAAAVAPSLISAGASFGLSKLFGGDEDASSSLSNFQVPGIDAGGLKAIPGPGGVQVTSSGERQGLVGSLSRTFPEQAKLLSELRGQVTPGFGRLTTSRLAEIESARARSVGNLRENLQRRRVLGSSFASDALARTEAEFAQQAERVQAESFLQELELSTNLIAQEFTVARGEFTTQLDELNLQADLASQLASGATATLAANARLSAELDARASAGAGQFFGQTFQPIIDSLGSSVSDFFAKASIGSSLAASTAIA